MNQDALVVGINTYGLLNSLKAPANDAEAIAQRLEKYSDFRVRRLPLVRDKENPENDSGRVGQTTPIALSQLEEALVQLFLPQGSPEEIPETALLFFAGHGLRKDRGIQEGFLATSDVNPELGNWGLSLQWLRQILKKSPVQKQIIWLDCCYSGELLNFEEFEQTLQAADPGTQENRDRCFITASRAFEVAREQASGNHGVLTAALLKGIDPTKRPNGWVTSHTLADFIKQELGRATQAPICHNSGRAIVLTNRLHPLGDPSLKNVCPYKGLKFFNQADANFFYGRTRLTDLLIDRVRTENFIAVLGASGSGKSSVLRAGLLHQLKQGTRLSGSDRWQIYEPFTPGKNPIASLERAIGKKANEIEQLCQLEFDRIVLVVDQFEECFTLCQDNNERQQFFDRLLSVVKRSGNKFYLVLGMRADFLGKCAEYAGLANQIQNNLVMVEPMTRKELEDAIQEPAKQVGIGVETELVERLIEDVADSPGSLPLLEYTLEELWKARQRNWLTLPSYRELGGDLGGIKGILNQQANEVYEKLKYEEKPVAQRIFLELTQLGDVDNTRRRVKKQDLIDRHHPEELLERVIQELVAARLIVTATDKTDELESKSTVIDIAHEALIRHWRKLGEWIKEYRVAIEIERKIEEGAKEWKERGKPKSPGLLLQDERLIDAERYLKNYQHLGFLNGVAEEFIQVSQEVRDRLLVEAKNRKRWRIGAAIAFPSIIAISALIVVLLQGQYQNTLEAVFLDSDSTEILSKLPGFLNEADRYRNSKDRLSNTSVDTVINYYDRHKSEIDRSFSYYRQILRVAGRLKQQNKNNPTSDRISSEAEKSLAYMILKYRIPELKQYLFQKPNPQFGELLHNTEITDFENQYTEGAQRETYEILMRPSGVGADLNNDGLILDEQEANQLPCDVLKEIQSLWREATANRCDWYGTDIYSSLTCHELDINANTLTTAIFKFDSVSVIEKRLNYCGIALSNPQT